MIALGFANLRKDGELAHDEDFLLRIIAQFQIFIDDQLFFDEPDFPILELADQLQKWVRKGAHDEFSYESMETSDHLLTFARIDGGWRIHSDWQKFEHQGLVRGELLDAVRAFLREAISRTNDELGVNVRQLMR